MSHVVTIETLVRDATAVAAACNRLGLPPPTQRTVQLFDAIVEGLAVELPEWRYPVVCDLATGSLRYDNFQGSWGDRTRLNQFLQAYAAEKAKLEARRQGHSVTEQQLSDGSLKLTINLVGGPS
jgi:hypothetical protein